MSWLVDHTLRRDRLVAERELRAMAAEQDEVVWIRHDWLDSLGRERINAVLGEYGYPAMRPHAPGRRALVHNRAALPYRRLFKPVKRPEK